MKYQVRTKELDAIRFSNNYIEECRKYCTDGYVICEMKDIKMGFRIRIFIMPFDKLFGRIKWTGIINILWLHIGFSWETREIVKRVVD